jgi:prepilin-type N-terminal cleavage/methylation domain-containing protein
MRGRKAFTLIEVLVVCTIFAMLSVVDIIDYRRADRNRRLSGAADEMASRIKQAQGLAYANAKQFICSTDNKVCLSGSACDASFPTNCVSQYVTRYGVRFDTDGSNNKYMIGADYSSFGSFTVGEAIPSGTVTLPSGITMSSITSADNPPTRSATLYDLNFIYDSTNASPFITCSSNCLTTVVLKDAQTNATKTVTVQKRTGLVMVQ